MELERRTGLPGDPFWDVVRRRVPTAVPVLLPPASPAPPASDGPPADPVTDDALEGARLETTVLLRALWAEALGDDQGHEAPPASLRPGPGSATLVATASMSVRSAVDGARMFERLADALAGWRVRRRDGAVRVIEAGSAGRTVRATFRPDLGVLVVVATSAVLPVTRDRSRRLRGGAS